MYATLRVSIVKHTKSIKYTVWSTESSTLCSCDAATSKILCILCTRIPVFCIFVIPRYILILEYTGGELIVNLVLEQFRCTVSRGDMWNREH